MATASCCTLQRVNIIHFLNNYITYTEFNSGVEFCECNILAVVWEMYKVKSANAQQARTIYIFNNIWLNKICKNHEVTPNYINKI